MARFGVLRVPRPPRRGVEGLLVSMAPAGGRGFSATAYKPFLHHVTKNEPQRGRTVTLTQPRLHPKVLTAKQVQTILDACEHLRDRLLFALLLDTGMFSRGQSPCASVVL